MRCVDKLGINIKVLWDIPDRSGDRVNIALYLEAENADEVIKELKKLDCTATVLEC